MKSIPVSVSSARMLRPSRPMIRPFSSSDLSSTTDTVVSTAWPEASRPMTVERMLRARLSASRRASSSTWRTSRALSWRSSSSSSRIMICFACAALRPATRSSSRIWSRFDSLQLSRAVIQVALAVLERALLLAELRLLEHRACSRARAAAPPGEPAPSGAPAAPARARPGERGAAGAATARVRSGALTVPPFAASARGRCTNSTTATATAGRHERCQAGCPSPTSP